MGQKFFTYRRRDLLIIGLGAVLFFAAGWYLQSGWTRVKVEQPPAPVIEEDLSNKVVLEQKETQSLVDFRLERDREHSRQRERLQEMLTAAETGTDWAKQVQTDLLGLERRINHEHELENLLTARGYPDSGVAVNDSTVTIVIKGQTLSAEQVGLIGQWAADVSGYPIGQIRIADQK